MAAAGTRDVRRGAATAIVLALVVAGGCTTIDVEPAPEPPGRSSAAPETTSPTPTASPTAAPRARPVTIAVAGDIHFEGVLADRLRDPTTALRPAARALSAADLTIVNLESSVGTGGRPEPGKRFTFSVGPEAFAALAEAGVDVASMANNHALDFGRARLPSTLRAARSAATTDPPLAVVGIGRDRDHAFRPALTQVDDTLIATLAATVADRDPTADPTGQWAATAEVGGTADALDPTRLLAEVRRADRRADIVVAYLHWGVQGERCPSDDQRTLADRLVDAGADVVVGSHAHELQGDGRLGPGYVAYGLGNFAWYSPGPTGVLTLTVRPPRTPAGRASVTRSRWWPAVIGADGLASRVRGDAAAQLETDRQALRDCAGLVD